MAPVFAPENHVTVAHRDDGPLIQGNGVLKMVIDAGATGVELDLSGVTFLDSSALNALVVGRRMAVDAGVPVTIVAASQVVRRMLDLTALTAVFGLPEP